jgi:hypothetical protein
MRSAGQDTTFRSAPNHRVLCGDHGNLFSCALSKQNVIKNLTREVNVFSILHLEHDPASDSFGKPPSGLTAE